MLYIPYEFKSPAFRLRTSIMIRELKGASVAGKIGGRERGEGVPGRPRISAD